MPRIPPTLLALACVVVWSFIPIVAALGQLNSDGLQFLFWTNLFSTLAVGLTIQDKPQALLTIIKQTHPILSAVLGFLGCFFYYLCLYYGYKHGDIIATLVVQYLWPALIVVIALLMFKESLSINKIVAIVLGFGATFLVVTQGDLSSVSVHNVTALFLVFIGAVGFALFSILARFDQNHPVSLRVFLYFLWGTIFSFLALCLWSNFIIPTGRSLFIVILNGVIINGLSYLLWIEALARSEASKIAPLVYITPVLSMVWVTVLFGKPFSLINFIAVIMVIMSGYWPLAKALDRQKNNADGAFKHRVHAR